MNGHPRILSFAFWLAVLGGLAAAVFIFVRVLFGGGAAPAAAAPSRLYWLLTLEGERRGLAIESDLRRDGQSWELWGPGPGLATLNSIANLRPGTLFSSAGFGFNGGFWDEAHQPVGVCAGERGIYGTRSHPGGFALTAARAWIGPLTARVRLAGAGNTSRGLDLALNPRPLPRRAPYLIDPAVLGAPVKSETPSQILWLGRASHEPLRFNTSCTLTLLKAFRQAAGRPLEAAPEGALIGVIPEKEKGPPNPLPAPGRVYRLNLLLEQVRGKVRLATCAGPRLIANGRISEALARGEESRAERTWRTAVGCDASGRYLWVVMLARGRDGLPGATLRETAQTLRDLGATEALNLDGGSSTSVWYSHLNSELHPLFPLQSEIHHAIFLRQDLPLAPPRP